MISAGNIVRPGRKNVAADRKPNKETYWFSRSLCCIVVIGGDSGEQHQGRYVEHAGVPGIGPGTRYDFGPPKSSHPCLNGAFFPLKTTDSCGFTIPDDRCRTAGLPQLFTVHGIDR